MTPQVQLTQIVERTLNEVRKDVLGDRAEPDELDLREIRQRLEKRLSNNFDYKILLNEIRKH